MEVQQNTRKRYWGTRDPQWLFHPEQGMLLLILAYFIMMLLVGRPDSLSTSLWLVSWPVALLTSFLWGGVILDRYGPNHNAVIFSVSAMKDAHVVGTKAELANLTYAAKADSERASVFRSVPTIAQQRSLKIVGIIFIIFVPCSGLFNEPDPRWLGALGLVAYATVLIQHIISRPRYKVTGGALIVEHINGLSVRHQQRIELSGASLRVDFGAHTFSCTSHGEGASISLFEVLSPHALVSAILAAASQLDGLCALPNQVS